MTCINEWINVVTFFSHSNIFRFFFHISAMDANSGSNSDGKYSFSQWPTVCHKIHFACVTQKSEAFNGISAFRWSPKMKVDAEKKKRIKIASAHSWQGRKHFFSHKGHIPIHKLGGRNRRQSMQKVNFHSRFFFSSLWIFGIRKCPSSLFCIGRRSTGNVRTNRKRARNYARIEPKTLNGMEASARRRLSTSSRQPAASPIDFGDDALNESV